jgi:hypothetical protein
MSWNLNFAVHTYKQCELQIITKYFDAVKNRNDDFKKAKCRHDSNEIFNEIRYLILITAITSTVVKKIEM